MPLAHSVDRLKASPPALARSPRLAAIAAIAIYRAAISPVIHAMNGPACRFEPSCSAYARDAIAEYGMMRGCAMALWRIARCNPMGGHGYDPVPRRGAESGSLARYRERVRVRDVCAARLSDALHILMHPQKLAEVPHQPLKVSRQPLPTKGEAIRGPSTPQTPLGMTRDKTQGIRN